MVLYLKPTPSAQPACTEPARERLRLLGACAGEGVFALAPAATGGAGGSEPWGSAGPPLAPPARLQRGCTPRKETLGNSHLQRIPLKIRPQTKPHQLWRLHSVPAALTETFETPLPDVRAQAGPLREVPVSVGEFKAFPSSCAARAFCSAPLCRFLFPRVSPFPVAIARAHCRHRLQSIPLQDGAPEDFGFALNPDIC